jgi:hypothetical protein
MRAVTNHTPLSSSGLTGRSSTPQRLVSVTAALEYWIPAFAGMTGGVVMTTKRTTGTLK